MWSGCWADIGNKKGRLIIKVLIKRGERLRRRLSTPPLGSMKGVSFFAAAASLKSIVYCDEKLRAIQSAGEHSKLQCYLQFDEGNRILLI